MSIRIITKDGRQTIYDAYMVDITNERICVWFRNYHLCGYEAVCKSYPITDVAQVYLDNEVLAI